MRGAGADKLLRVWIGTGIFLDFYGVAASMGRAVSTLRNH